MILFINRIQTLGIPTFKCKTIIYYIPMISRFHRFVEMKWGWFSSHPRLHLLPCVLDVLNLWAPRAGPRSPLHDPPDTEVYRLFSFPAGRLP